MAWMGKKVKMAGPSGNPPGSNRSRDSKNSREEVMRFRTIALAGAMALFAGAAFADDPMANTYANTVMTVNKATGAKGTLLFNQDGTYTGKTTDAKGAPVSYPGHWTLKDSGATICLTIDAPPNAPANPQMPKPSCSPLQKHAVGDSWTVTNDQGETYDISLAAGR
jgi:hypothetical protein